MRTRIRLLSCVLLLLLTAGCGTGSRSFTWFVDEIPSNLDPQLASAPPDRIACTNLYAGLLRKAEDGSLQNDLCESYTVSHDGLTYTFRLRNGLTYLASRGASSEYAITAEDFVFAFRRVFRAETRSPYSTTFAALKNSAAVLAGEMDETALGVEAADPLTLVFTLQEPDDDFLTKLTLPGAMPCDEDFFISTGGAYGLTMKNVLSSGPFYLYNWTTGGLFLRRNIAAPLVDNLRLVQNTGTLTDAVRLIENERCSAIVDEEMNETSLRSQTYTDTTWALLFNCDSVFRSVSLRRALTAVVAGQSIRPALSLYGEAEGLIPRGAQVDALDYRAQSGTCLPALSPADARSLYAQAQTEVSKAALKTITLLIPAEASMGQLAGELNSLWQKELSLFLSIEEADAETFARRLSTGNYTIALSSLRLENDDPAGLLTSMTEAPVFYNDEVCRERLAQADTVTGQARLELLAECERQLVRDCAAVPLFCQYKRLLLADGIDGLIFDPYGPLLDLTWTELG